MENTFDRTQLAPLEQSVKRIVGTAYDHCLYQCNESKVNLANCKQECFANIQTPYNVMKHQARDSEENLYKRCLASKLPNIKQEDYAECSKNIYNQRVEILLGHFSKVSQDLLVNLNC